jgi:hypothetical protein
MSGLPLCSKQQWASFFRESRRDPYIPLPCDRQQKVLHSNLGLTVFVKASGQLVKQVPQPALRKRKKPNQTKQNKKTS